MSNLLRGDDILVTIVGRLLESDLGSLEHLVVTCRSADTVRTIDATTALGRLLGEAGPGDPSSSGDPETAAVHRAMLAAWPEFTAAVSGVALHLRDLLAAGLAQPEPTSMMRKRGVTDVGAHVVEPAALAPVALAQTLSLARARAAANAMKHVLIIASDGTVHVAGRTPEETMAHWSNVEFSARVECMRVEERVAHRLPL